MILIVVLNLINEDYKKVMTVRMKLYYIKHVENNKRKEIQQRHNRVKMLI